MRSMWSGAISFGLVNIPVKLYSAAGENALNLDMLAKKDLSPIKYLRVAASDGREVPYNEIVKGYEVSKGHYVVLDDKDFEKANAKKTKTIDILSFVLEDEIDPLYYEKPYYLEPEKSAEKPYALLREALKESRKVGIARYVIRNREHLAVIKPVNNVILLNQIRYQADIRDFSKLHLPGEANVTKPELEMAKKLIDQLTEKFEPSQYKDTYLEELKTLIEAKAEGKVFEGGEEAPAPTNVKDLMETLKASLSMTESHRPPVSRKATTETKAKTRRKTKKS